MRGSWVQNSKFGFAQVLIRIAKYKIRQLAPTGTMKCLTIKKYNTHKYYDALIRSSEDKNCRTFFNLYAAAVYNIHY